MRFEPTVTRGVSPYYEYSSTLVVRKVCLRRFFARSSSYTYMGSTRPAAHLPALDLLCQQFVDVVGVGALYTIGSATVS